MKPLVFIALVLGALMTGQKTIAQPFSAKENSRHERVMKSLATPPDRTRMNVVDTMMFVETDGGAGVLIYYDDVLTKLQIDCVELYDLEGKLLVVTWIDGFGVYQVAMDRGLLDPDNPHLDGVLVRLDVGERL